MNKELIVNIVAYFIIYSFFGWILESIAKTIIQKKVVNSGFLYGPVCPIYGIGALIMYSALEWFKFNYILVFISGFIILSVWEYLVGWLLEKVFNTKYWDYSEYKFNIKGRVCLINSVFWGFLGVTFVYVIHPFVSGKLELLSNERILVLNIIIIVIMLIDLIISVIKVKNLDEKVKLLTDISDSIKEKLENLEKLKDKDEHKQLGIESLQKIIDELNIKQKRLRRKIYRQTYRLKKAFPTMKSEKIEKITEFLKQKGNELRNKQKEK